MSADPYMRGGLKTADDGALRPRSHCRFRTRGTEYVSEFVMKWMSGSTERQCDRTLGALMRGFVSGKVIATGGNVIFLQGALLSISIIHTLLQEKPSRSTARC